MYSRMKEQTCLLWCCLVMLFLFSDVASAGDHAEPEGMLLRQDGAVAVVVWEGMVQGEVEAFHESTTSDISVSFLDADSVEFVLDTAEGFLLYAELADSGAVAFDQTGDWTFTLTGLLEGKTGMSVGVFHVDHVDWLSPEIPVHVEDPHAEAEGLVLRLDGVDQIRVFEGAVDGALVVGNGSVVGPYEIVFLNPEGEEFLPESEDGFSLWAAVGDSGLVSFVQTGDWAFSLEGLTEGDTDLGIGILHAGHLDYESPGIPVGVMDPAGVEPVLADLTPMLLPPWPNPVSTAATLRFRLPTASAVDLGVFDTNGRRVDTLLSGVVPGGERSVTWIPGDLPGGIYYVRMRTAEQAQTTRVVVAR